jgi:hypothetical protein
MILVMAVILFAGCAEGYRSRPLRRHEAAIISAASDGLLSRVNYLGARPDCQIGAVIIEAKGNDRDLEVLPATLAEDCMLVHATPGALDLPLTELRALIAHGLAHVALGHTSGGRVTTSGRRATAESGYRLQRIYSPQEETDADRLAARLLDVGCPALGNVLERVRDEGSRWTEWKKQHPLTTTRPPTARGFCENER